MKIDIYDLWIIDELNKPKGVLNYSTLAKEVYDIDDRQDLQAKTSSVYHKIKKLRRYGFLKIIKRKGKKFYKLNRSRLMIPKTSSIKVKMPGYEKARKMPVDNLILVHIKEGFFLYGFTST